jgi:RecA-family ATPase
LVKIARNVEMWRRIEGMLPFFGARMAELGDIRLVDLVGENSVLGLLTKGIIEPTPMYGALDAYMAEFKPGLVELDVLADLFSGEENNRPQVTQFVGLLKRLCRKHHCAILLLAQPSVAGMNTGSGTRLDRLEQLWTITALFPKGQGQRRR